MSHLYVNGPLNVIRFEGPLGKNKKVFYFFIMAMSDSVVYETMCDSYESIDLVNYIYDSTQKIKSRKLHSFIYTNINKQIINEKEKINPYSERRSYENEIIDLIKRNTEAKKKDEPIKYYVSESIEYINYIYYDVYKLIGRDILNMIIDTIISSFQEYNYTADTCWIFDKIICNLLIIKKITYEVAKLFEIENKTKKTTPKLSNDEYQKYIDETTNNLIKNNVEPIQQSIKKYPIKNIQDTHKKEMIELINIINQMIDESIKDLDYAQSIGYIQKNVRDPNSGSNIYGVNYSEINLIVEKNKNNIYEISDIYKKITVTVSEAYCLNTILDDKFIDNCIVCAKYISIENIIEILLKTYNFEITHVAYSSEKDITKLNKTIKNGEKNKDYNALSLFCPQIYKQCVDLVQFPENFS